MKKQYVVILPLVLCLAACSNSSNSNSNSNNNKDQSVVIPQNLGFQKPAAGAELTKDQAAEIKRTFKGKPMMTLPPGELVFPDKNTPAYERIEKERILQAEDPNAYALLMETRNNCAKGHPSLHFDATFPAEQVTSENAFDVLQKGDRLSYSGDAGLTGSNACPVELSMGTGMAADVKDVDRNERSGSASANIGGKFKFVMKNQKYANLLNSRGIIVDTNISGLMVHREITKGSKDNALLSYTLSGSYLSLKADIPYSIDVKMLGSGVTEGDSRAEVVASVTLKYPTFAANLVVHTITENGQQISAEAYLNGRPVSNEELNNLFGENVPGQESQGQISKALLN